MKAIKLNREIAHIIANKVAKVAPMAIRKSRSLYMQRFNVLGTAIYLNITLPCGDQLSEGFGFYLTNWR